MNLRRLTLILALPTTIQAQDLLGVYDLALQHDPKIRAAEDTRNAALENRPQSIAKLLPTISTTLQSNRNSVLTKLPPQNFIQQTIAGGRRVDFWDSFASISLRQPIYHHDYWVQLGQADNLIAQAEATYASAQQDLMLRTAKAYFDILLAQDSLEFAKAEQASIERQLDQAKARFEVGLIAITDVNVAQAAYDQAQANVIQSENDLDDAKEAMREIVGPFDGALSDLIEEVPLKSPEPASIDEWDHRAQQSNLDIIAAQNNAEFRKKDIDVNFAGHLPSVDVVGNANFTDNNRPVGVSIESQSIGMQVNVPLFQGGAVNSRVRQARHTYEAALENVDVQRRSVVKQVKNAYRGILSSIGQVKALKTAVISSQSALDATEAGLEVGTRTMVDVLTEQRNLYKAMLDYSRSRYDYVINGLTLKQAASVLGREDLELVNQWLAAGHTGLSPKSGPLASQP